MKKIAVLLTCFNRKEKTIKSLQKIYEALQKASHLTLEVFLTDDNSSDGTSEAVRKTFPETNILMGNGELYWAGGMRNSWNAALEHDFDAYLLMNDDTFVTPNLFEELLETHAYCMDKYKKAGIYVGSTYDSETKQLTYGGSIVTNKFLAHSKRVPPNGYGPQECDLGNANIMLVHDDVVKKIGILSEAYVHELADYDYTLMAKRKKIPVLITPNYIGSCINDHKNPYQNLHKLSLKERIKLLYNPVGLDHVSHMNYVKRNFPIRLPLVYVFAWVKVLFPKLYTYRFNRQFNNPDA